jgi:hypothetical protein
MLDEMGAGGEVMSQPDGFRKSIPFTTRPYEYQRPQGDASPGYPKRVDCLGWCNKKFVAKHPGERFCKKCRVRKKMRSDSCCDLPGQNLIAGRY